MRAIQLGAQKECLKKRDWFAESGSHGGKELFAQEEKLSKRDAQKKVDVFNEINVALEVHAIIEEYTPPSKRGFFILDLPRFDGHSEKRKSKRGRSERTERVSGGRFFGRVQGRDGAATSSAAARASAR